MLAIWWCYCTENLPHKVSSFPENAGKAASKWVISVGLFVLLVSVWLMILGVSGIPFQMSVCVSDINKELGKHGRLPCSLHPHISFMGLSGCTANSHGGLALEREKARGTEQELPPSVTLEHLQPMVGAAILEDWI